MYLYVQYIHSWCLINFPRVYMAHMDNGAQISLRSRKKMYAERKEVKWEMIVKLNPLWDKETWVSCTIKLYTSILSFTNIHHFSNNKLLSVSWIWGIKEIKSWKPIYLVIDWLHEMGMWLSIQRRMRIFFPSTKEIVTFLALIPCSINKEL